MIAVMPTCSPDDKLQRRWEQEEKDRIEADMLHDKMWNNYINKKNEEEWERIGGRMGNM